MENEMKASPVSNNTENGTKGFDLKKLLSNSITFLGLILLILFFEIITKGNMLTQKNIELVFKQGYALLLVSLAGVYVMSTGNLDFSLGANVGFSCVCATLTATYINPVLSIPVAILVGLAVGIVNGITITKFKIPSFIACLCMMFILMASTQSLIPGSSIMMPFTMMGWETNTMKIIVGVIYLVIMIIMFNYTIVGKQLKCLGVSKEAARQSGTNVDRMMFIAYCITGIAAGIAGFFMMLRTGGAATTTGTTMTTDVIIAVVFGGMSISGGATSKISAAILGTLIVTVLNNGMVLAGFGGDTQQLVKGILFLVIIAVSMKHDSNVIVK